MNQGLQIFLISYYVATAISSLVIAYVFFPSNKNLTINGYLALCILSFLFGFIIIPCRIILGIIELLKEKE